MANNKDQTMRSLVSKARTMRCLYLSLSYSHIHTHTHNIHIPSSSSPSTLFSVSHFFLSHFLHNNFKLLLSKLKPICFFFFQGFRFPTPIRFPGIRAFRTNTTLAVSGQTMDTRDSVSYLTQREAAEIDENLMGPLGFSVDQLMVNLNFSSCFSISYSLVQFRFARCLTVSICVLCAFSIVGIGWFECCHVHSWGN